MADPEMLTNLDLRQDYQGLSPRQRHLAMATQLADSQEDLEDTISTYTHVQNDKV